MQMTLVSSCILNHGDCIGLMVILTPLAIFRWGNRYTKGDRSLGTVRQDMLKRYAWWFNLFLVLVRHLYMLFAAYDICQLAGVDRGVHCLAVTVC